MTLNQWESYIWACFLSVCHFTNQREHHPVVLLMFLCFHLVPLFLFSSGEGLSSSNLSLLRRASVVSWDTSSPANLFRRVLPSPVSSHQTSPALYRHERHFSEPCPPGLTPSLCDSLLESSSPGAARRCSAPGGLLGEIPEVVVHPPLEEEDEEEEEEVFRDRRGRVSRQDLTGKYWHVTVWSSLQHWSVLCVAQNTACEVKWPSFSCGFEWADHRCSCLFSLLNKENKHRDESS